MSYVVNGNNSGLGSCPRASLRSGLKARHVGDLVHLRDHYIDDPGWSLSWVSRRYKMSTGGGGADSMRSAREDGQRRHVLLL